MKPYIIKEYVVVVQILFSFVSGMQVDEAMNEQLFKAFVMQTIVSKIPHRMPSFDRTDLISTVEKHLGPMTLRIENIQRQYR